MKIDPITKFTVWCSGANFKILELCPSRSLLMYSSIGTNILLNSTLAGLASFYLILLVFKSYFVSIFSSLLFALMIFNLDRLIANPPPASYVLADRDEKFHRISQAIPRIILAVLTAFIIALPFQVKIFEEEINNHIRQAISLDIINRIPNNNTAEA
jgi:hypothetical protein